MKKFIFLLIALITVFSVSAQTVALPKMQAGFTWAAVTTPYQLSVATVRNFTIAAPQLYATTQDFIVELDTVAGTPTQHATVSVALFGQKSAIAGDWTAIGSAKIWHNTTTDTVIILSNATANRYSNYKITYTGSNTSGAKSQITQQYLKLYLE
jgi:hypothetical protein